MSHTLFEGFGSGSHGYVSPYDPYEFERMAFEDEPFGTERAPEPTPAEAMLDKLTPAQRTAVEHRDAPLLVIAGAGSGKTRVLTTRVAHRLRPGDMLPAHVLALTFTNRAAAEMKHRIASLVGPAGKALDCGTFHSIFAAAIRTCDSEGFVRRDFTILDTTDQKDVLKDAAAALDPDFWEQLKKVATKDILGEFSRYKTSAYPNQPRWTNEHDIPRFPEILAKYDEIKRLNNVLDFDDVLYAFDELLNIPRIREMFQRRWRMILVDEFQDTNAPQHSILSKLAERHRNITCVGDDDQSIYSWRQADVSKILNFTDHWPDATVIKLESNFRSTPEILEGANNLIGNNTLRHGKTLLATRPSGAPIRTVSLKTPWDEARFVCRDIVERVRSGIDVTEIAVISRVGAGLNEIQRELINAGVRFVVHAGTNVADRVETKTVAAYIRISVNELDNTAFMYAYQTKPRGIGKKSIGRFKDLARDADATLEEILRQHCRAEPGKKTEKVVEFLDDLSYIRSMVTAAAPTIDIVEEIILRCGILEDMERDRDKAATATGKDERDKLESLLASRQVNLDQLRDHARTAADLAELSANIILSNEEVATDEKTLWLGTIHAAKGLEFTHLYMPAFETGIIPSPRTLQGELRKAEEERNLAFVALTRAKDTATITWAENRVLYASQGACGGPSSFVGEMRIP